MLPRDGVLTLREWRPSGVTARLSRRRDDGELELEVPDDRHLPSTRRGGAERAAALRALGWLDTDSVPGGWVCWRWPTPATARQLAAAALDTLHLVFAVERPERLGVRAVLGSASARLPMPDVPLLEYDPMTYVTQRGPRIEPERARNGRYLVTEDGDRQLVEHDEKEYLVVDDPSGVGVLPEMVFGGTLLVPAPVDAPCVQVSTVATTRTQPTTTAIVLERGGKYLLTQPPGTATQAWVHDEDVVVREYRVPSHPVRNAR